LATTFLTHDWLIPSGNPRGVTVTELEPILRTIVEPGLRLLPRPMDTDPARVMLLAIGLQESRLIHRRQIGGPARGLWQFERGGGVVGVLRHPASAELADQVCAGRRVEPTPAALYAALEFDDLLACAIARLLLFTDPRSLPRTDAPAESAWNYYIRNWRPGKPHRKTWDGFHAAAVDAVRAYPSFANVVSGADTAPQS
jgi:hypothetical protein